MTSRMDTAWAISVKEGLKPLLSTLAQSDKLLLDKAGLYREKINAYQKGKHFPHVANLLAAMALLRLQVSITDPETGRRFVLRFEELEGQMELPLSH